MPPAPGWLSRLPGKFIVFDGPDGSGKSTQFARFAAFCREQGVSVCEVREPGGTPIGEQIRRVLLDPAHAEMSVRCEMLLYMASRAQLVEQTIRPALQRGELVLADRFISSTLAYQGAAGGLGAEEIMQVGRIAIGESWPDLTVIFDVDEGVAMKRMVGSAQRQRRTDGAGASLFSDRVELQDSGYHHRVRHGYLDQAQADSRRYLVIDASGSADGVFTNLLAALSTRLA